ncbi:hypothetical protein [Burkholderia stagnalis]|uniref:hypothetical protein n=1 Tax=Burkholderia stagnalis TaxID=1503054 RepID=UPI0012D8FDFA|nr:hypothetical protein [Burkholderia stagnalis]
MTNFVKPAISVRFTTADALAPSPVVAGFMPADSPFPGGLATASETAGVAGADSTESPPHPEVISAAVMAVAAAQCALPFIQASISWISRTWHFIVRVSLP